MSRMMITVIITYLLTRLFYGISGFDPVRVVPGLPGYLLDLGIWVLSAYLVFWALSTLGIGTVKDRKSGQ